VPAPWQKRERSRIDEGEQSRGAARASTFDLEHLVTEMTVRRITPRARRAAALAIAAAFVLPTAALAQNAGAGGRALSISAGAFQYDLSGTGTTPMVAFRADFALNRALLLEGGFGLARPGQDFGGRATIVTPEAQLQLQLPLGRVLPYVGVGGGAALGGGAGDFDAAVTASAAGGVRTWLTERAGLRAELRVRGIGSGFEGAAAEWTGGFAWRF